MMSDEFEVSRETGRPIDALDQCFAAFGWQVQRQGDDEIIASVQGSWTNYEMRAVCRDDDRALQFLCFPDIRINSDQYPVVHETISLVNEQLWVGHFELWHATGLIVYRHALILEPAEEMGMSIEQAETVTRNPRLERMRALLSGVPIRFMGRKNAPRGHRRLDD